MPSRSTDAAATAGRKPGSVPSRFGTATTDRWVATVLAHLRHQIRRKGFNQLKVQRRLGWGRTYLSQLFRRQKSLRLDQILDVLETIEVPPVAFFTEVFLGSPDDPPGLSLQKFLVEGIEGEGEVMASLRLARLELWEVIGLLEERKLISMGEVAILKALGRHDDSVEAKSGGRA